MFVVRRPECPGDGAELALIYPSLDAIAKAGVTAGGGRVFRLGAEMPAPTTRLCAACGEEIVETNSMGDDLSRTACSPSCRQKLYRQRKKAAGSVAKGGG